MEKRIKENEWAKQQKEYANLTSLGQERMLAEEAERKQYLLNHDQFADMQPNELSNKKFNFSVGLKKNYLIYFLS